MNAYRRAAIAYRQQQQQSARAANIRREVNRSVWLFTLNAITWGGLLIAIAKYYGL